MKGIAIVPKFMPICAGFAGKHKLISLHMIELLKWIIYLLLTIAQAFKCNGPQAVNSYSGGGVGFRDTHTIA